MNNIEFSCEDQSIIDHFPIKPANKVVPDWYKNLNTWNEQVPTIKNCMPVQDYITSGYIIQNTYEVVLTPLLGTQPEEYQVSGHNPTHIESHGYTQFPIDFEGKQKHYIKIAQPWKIKTPMGYSCLFLQPFYHFEKRFKLFPSVVDTDNHDITVHLPGVLLSNDPVTLEPNTPLMQVIPFKRDDWQMNMTVKQKSKGLLDYFFSGGYRRIFHKKKNYK